MEHRYRVYGERSFGSGPEPKWGFPGGSDVRNPSANAGDVGLFPGREDTLEKIMATHSSLLAWEIPGTEKSGGLQSTGLQKSQTRLLD